MDEGGEPMAEGKRMSLRTGIYLLLFAAVCSGAVYLSYHLVVKERIAMEARLREKDERIGELEADNERLNTYLRLLQHQERRAHIQVLDQRAGADGTVINRIRFTEVDPDGTPIGKDQEFELPGDRIYVDSLVIKFEDHFVREGDPLRGKALVFFQRIFTNRVTPDEGHSLDEPGKAPEIYAAEKAQSAWERDLWRRFWEVGNDERLAREKQVKAMHGQAISQKLQPGKIYQVVVRNTGEATFPPPAELNE
ncbi:MAG: hypothetical protein JW793_09110 [Acidobacteria bacterium]|nr:hypothetical protein [Acidobacteriota bacterium]